MFVKHDDCMHACNHIISQRKKYLGGVDQDFNRHPLLNFICIMSNNRAHCADCRPSGIHAFLIGSVDSMGLKYPMFRSFMFYSSGKSPLAYNQKFSRKSRQSLYDFIVTSSMAT